MKDKSIFPVIVVILAGLFFNFIVIPNSNRSFHHSITKFTDLSKENIEGLRLYDNINDNKIILKYKKLINQSRNVIEYNYLELRKGVEIAVNSKGEILRFIVTEPGIETDAGIKVGDSYRYIKSRYGKNNYSRREQGMEILGFVDKVNNTSMEFWMYDNKVMFYRLDVTSMK